MVDAGIAPGNGDRGSEAIDTWIQDGKRTAFWRAKSPTASQTVDAELAPALPWWIVETFVQWKCTS